MEELLWNLLLSGDDAGTHEHMEDGTRRSGENDESYGTIEARGTFLFLSKPPTVNEDTREKKRGNAWNATVNQIRRRNWKKRGKKGGKEKRNNGDRKRGNTRRVKGIEQREGREKGV